MPDRIIKILLVEDSEDDITLIDMHLERAKMKHEMTIVTERKEFLEMIASHKFDIVVCDHSLPQFNSGEAFEIAVNNIPQTPFIVISGIADEEDLIKVFEKGADNYVMKDNLKRLPSAILRAIKLKKIEFGIAANAGTKK